MLATKSHKKVHKYQLTLNNNSMGVIPKYLKLNSIKEKQQSEEVEEECFRSQRKGQKAKLAKIIVNPINNRKKIHSQTEKSNKNQPITINVRSIYGIKNKQRNPQNNPFSKDSKHSNEQKIPKPKLNLNINTLNNNFQCNQNTVTNFLSPKTEISPKQIGPSTYIKSKYFKNANQGFLNEKLNKMKSPTSKIANFSSEVLTKRQIKGFIKINKIQNKDLLKNVVIIKKIGNGQTGDINLVVSKETGFIFVMKCFKKKKVHLPFLIDQFKIQLFCNHPNILPAYGYYINQKQAYLLLEAGQTTLFRLIAREGRLSQIRTAHFIIQVLEGLNHLHRNGVIHRDLKPENIILFEETIAKIADFGWSIHTPDTMRKTFCGTYDYVSPQVARGDKYDYKIDSWSVGVLAFQMISGRLPFDQKKIFEGSVIQLQNSDFSVVLSDICKDFIKKLLTHNPSSRMSIKEALQHQWIKQKRNKLMKLNQKNQQLKRIAYNIDMIFDQ